MTRHQYGISALFFQTSFRGETSGGVVKCRLFSLSWILDSTLCIPVSRSWIPDFCSSVQLGFQIPIVLGFRNPWAEFRIPKRKIPNSISKSCPVSVIRITSDKGWDIALALLAKVIFLRVYFLKMSRGKRRKWHTDFRDRKVKTSLPVRTPSKSHATALKFLKGGQFFHEGGISRWNSDRPREITSVPQLLDTGCQEPA